MKWDRSRFALAGLWLVLALLSGCGGGGGNGEQDTEPTPVANNWDQLQWDKGNWQ